MKRSVAPILWFHKHQLKDKDKDAEKKECKSIWKTSLVSSSDNLSVGSFDMIVRHFHC